MLGHLSALMRPLVAALRSGDDLVTHALRILEHWVDSLNPEFLEPPMATVAPQLMLALWALLKPTSGAVGHKAHPHHPAENGVSEHKGISMHIRESCPSGSRLYLQRLKPSVIMYQPGVGPAIYRETGRFVSLVWAGVRGS
jgi:hypothetical protein